MAFHPRFRLAASMLLGCAVLEFSTPAEACSSPCPNAVQLPPNPWMPGNLIYFGVLSNNPGPLELRTKSGEPIAASIRTIGNHRVFAPDAPIPQGAELVLEYSVDLACAGASPPQQFEFTADLHGAIELRPAELEIVEEGTANPGQQDESSFVRLRYYSPDSNGAATHLMTSTFTVDGLPLQWLRNVSSEEDVEVSVSCRPQYSSPLIDSCGNVHSVPPGEHTVRVSTTIIGQVNQPEPVEMTVDVRCPGDEDAPDNGGSPETEPSGGNESSEEDLGTPSVMPGVNASGVGSGCALAPNAPARRSIPTSALSALLVAGAVAGLRRRRRGSCAAAP